MDMMVALKGLAQEHRLTNAEAMAVLEWVTMPTIRPIVGIQEFIESPYYLNLLDPETGKSPIFPKVLPYLKEMNSGDYDEIVLTGSIGCAKTTCAIYSIIYQIYILSCYENPHGLYGLDSNSEIVFIFQSINAEAAKEVDYQRLRSIIEGSPYFKQYFPFKEDLESALVFPHHIKLKPVSSKETGAIGQNVIGGIIDEVNFMAKIEKSKQSIDGGTYDQAKALYNSIARRRKNRFGQAGMLPGLLCIVSSKRYPGQFTDVKKAERDRDLLEKGKSRIYYYDKRSWDVQPASKFMKERFWVFIGDATRRPHICAKDEKRTYGEQYYVHCPMDFINEARDDIMGFLRDICGVATIAKHPFFIELDKVSRCLGRTKNLLNKVKSTLAPDDTVLARPEFIRNRNSPRFVHIDLAISGDSAAMVMGHVEKFVEIKRGTDQYEILPKIVIDLVLQIPPPQGGEILFYRIRELIYTFKDKFRMPIMWVTLDSFQSKDTMQLLRQRGFTSGLQSMDTTNDPYVFLKGAFYDDRIDVPACNRLQLECAALEKDTRTNKIDHPAGGSKDISDALAGVVFGLTMRREVWAHFGIPIRQMPSLAKGTDDALKAPLPENQR